jgi:hypothetical protein
MYYKKGRERRLKKRFRIELDDCFQFPLEYTEGRRLYCSRTRDCLAEINARELKKVAGNPIYLPINDAENNIRINGIIPMQLTGIKRS